jgi:hypothetical protein
MSFGDPANAVAPPDNALGYPSRDVSLDALPSFRNPPSGYGQVPFWWWTGEDLNVDRMLWQVRELHKKGISGVQVNYSHYDTPGWLTEMDEPRLFTEEWWKVYSRISEECDKLGMGIGLSTYTLDWPRGAKNLFYHLFYMPQRPVFRSCLSGEGRQAPARRYRPEAVRQGRPVILDRSGRRMGDLDILYCSQKGLTQSTEPAKRLFGATSSSFRTVIREEPPRD